MRQRILIDGREFVKGRCTGIGRFLEGLLLAIHETHPEWKLTIAMDEYGELPNSLLDKVEVCLLSKLPELYWPKLAKNRDLFLSPYPKLPWRKLDCPSIHTVHDVFYLTHPAYQAKGLRKFAALWRLKHALKAASLTWFDSQVSKAECAALCAQLGDDYTIRYPAVEKKFIPNSSVAVAPFFLFVGNGLPHKNVELLLKAIKGTALQLKCVGIPVAVAEVLRSKYQLSKEQFNILQNVDDIQLLNLYQQTTCLLQPSTAEGYGYPPLEAMCCATPAIVSDIEVLRETTGGKATYCSPHDELAWRSAMLAMLKPSVRAEKVEQGLSWAIQHQGNIGWHQHIQDMESVMESG